jgi:hypothetical protein
MLQRLTEFGRRIYAAIAARCAPVHAYLRGGAWLGVFPWIVEKFWAALCALSRGTARLLRWMLVPKNDTPLDVLKHYVSLLVVLMGAGALLWAGKQIAYPPLVITVAKLPEPLEKEYWLNPELSRTLIGQIESLRAVVKGERDPAFEAVLNPPNIVVKSGDWSLNVQEQILTPLGSLLGRGQGEVHLALNCYHPGCARTNDKECHDLVPKASEAKPGESKPPESKAADGKPAKQYLCLRLTADIQRGLSHRRLTPRLIVSPDDAEMTDAMARVAEAVTTVADPATATLYFYRRIREEKRNPNVAPDTIADMVSEASKAAEQAETNDAVSACWAHTIRAHLAVDRREFSLAEVYLARAKNISLWSHLAQFSSPSDCRRLIMIAEMEFARQLARPPENETYPPHRENQDDGRVAAAFGRVRNLLNEIPGMAWVGPFARSNDNEDLEEALKLVRSEIGLSWFKTDTQCELLTAGRKRESLAAANDDGDGAFDRAIARESIRDAIEKLDSLRPAEQLAPLTRQGALDFMSRFSRNTKCTEDVVAILQRLDLNHPTDQRVTQLLIAITEAAALRKTASLGRPAEPDDKGNAMIESARKIYQRIAATGMDRTGSALLRLAIIAEANSAEAGENKTLARIPSDETLQNLRRAWQRYERDINATRERGELIVAFWGMVLMRSYPEEILTTDFTRAAPELVANEEYRNAIATKAEFEQALRTLYPDARATRFADLPQLKGIGPRIGCLCMLSYVTFENELADFFIGRLDRWQKQKIEQPACRRDLIPATQTMVPTRVRAIASRAQSEFEEAEVALQKAEAKTAKMQEEFEKKKALHEKLQIDLGKARALAEKNSQRFKEKREAVTKAAEVCYIDKVAPQAAQTTSSQ